MFIEKNRLIQLNKDIFGKGICQPKKLTPDYGRIVMPDPSLPRIKKYNIVSNNPLGYLINGAPEMNMQSQIQPNNFNVSQPMNIPEQQENDINSQSNGISENNNNNEINNYESNIKESIPGAQILEEDEPQEKKFTITNLGENNVILPPAYSTNDEKQYQLINLLNEPKGNFQLYSQDGTAEIYKREVSLIILIYK